MVAVSTFNTTNSCRSCRAALTRELLASREDISCTEVTCMYLQGLMRMRRG